jgi:hypothetical protein
VTKKNTANLTCRHCEQRCESLIARGLCWPCYKDADVRNKYPPVLDVPPKVTRDQKERQGRPPRDPTQFEPGTEGKIEVMAERVRRRETCFHPRDAKTGDADENRRIAHHEHKHEDDDG